MREYEQGTIITELRNAFDIVVACNAHAHKGWFDRCAFITLSLMECTEHSCDRFLFKPGVS